MSNKISSSLSSVNYKVKTDNYSVKEVYGDEYCLANNVDLLKSIAYDELWDQYDLYQRQTAVKALIECELRYLGIPYKLEIRFANDMDDSLRGFYISNQRIISINNNYLKTDNVYDAFVTGLHEARHVYQVCLCDIFAKVSPEERNLLCFEEVANWCANFDDYKDGDMDIEEYYYQVTEMDARSYAEDEIMSYIKGVLMLPTEE